MPFKNIEIGNSKTVFQKAVQQSQFYRGFSSTSDNPGNRLYDFDLIKQDIINQFSTKKGERVMNPTFGTIIWDLLMEPMTDEVRTALRDDISRICNSDPRVTPVQLDMIELESGYLLEITLVLNGTNQSSVLKLNFDQELGLQSQ
jgi:phage baseplate assembly protein W